MPEEKEKHLESVESVRWPGGWKGRRTMEVKIYGKDEF